MMVHCELKYGKINCSVSYCIPGNVCGNDNILQFMKFEDY